MKKSAAMLFGLMVSGLSVAGDNNLEQASTQLCSKIQACAQADVAKQKIPDDLREALTSMLGQMCANLDSYDTAIPDTALYHAASACLESMNQQSCQQLLNGDKTPECEQYEAVANQQ